MPSMRSSTTDSDTMSLHAPRHPVAQLQGPFEESMAEAINEAVDRTKPDPITRRTMLLEGPVYERVCAGRWKQKPGEKFHPLWKISAQMSFGINLLAEGLAKSEEDVMIILQTHVDDVDGFLESTTEDFDLAQSDVAERLRYLKLPLEHVDVFDRMLEDRTFRVSIVEGNKKIEHIMTRTSEATKDALKDVQKGLQATDTLGKYLEKVSLSWRTRSPELDAVFVAMVGNVEGWHRAFEDLYHQGTRLGASLVHLASIVSEMQRRASIASRKTPLKGHQPDYAAMRSQGSSPRQLGHRDNFTMSKTNIDIQSPRIPSKPLPRAPGVYTSSNRSTRRPSFQESRSGQISTVVLEDKTAMDKVERKGQAAQRPVLGDETKRLKTQKSAPNLKPKPEIINIVDVNGVSQLGLLGLGTGLGLGRMKETNSSTPVIVQRQSTEAHSNSKSPKEHSARILNAPVQDEAPPQRKRLSFSLRGKNKDRTTDGRMNPASPKASNNLLKSALLPRVGASAGPAGAPANAVSPALSASRSSPDNSHAIRSLNSSPRVASPGPSQTTPPSAFALKPPRKYNGHNPTFTSHPPNMEMATSLPKKQGETPEISPATLEAPGLRAVPDLDSGNTSYESSLGEPGPEVSAADESDGTGQELPIAELDSGTPTAQGPVELEAAVPNTPQPTIFELEAPQHSRPVPPNTSARMTPFAPTVGATIQSRLDFFELLPQQAGSHTSEGVEREQQSIHPLPPFTSSDKSQTVLFDRSFQLPPRNHFKVITLPSEGKATDVTASSSERNEMRSTVNEQSFQLPPASQQRVDRAKVDKEGSNDESVSTGGDGRILPSRIGTSDATITSKRQSPKHHLNLIEIISHTPPGSPIHERPESITSLHSAATSARLTSYRASIDLAPPEEAPAPPAPGGRSMVNPDYAMAGAFEGEKRALWKSGASMNGLKRMFSASSANHPRAGSVRVVELPEGRLSGGGLDGSADLATAGGSDVLWFNGMGRDGVWVSQN